MSGQTQTIREPPEGVLVGEDIPLENQEHDRKQSDIEEIIAQLKLRGEPYSEMDESALRERAERLLEGGE
jgi:hypothetical protein